MFKPYKGICIECKEDKWIQNSRGVCSDCVYKRNHNGMDRFETQNKRQKGKVNSLYSFKQRPLKTSKKHVKTSISEKRKKVLEKDRELYRYIFNTKPPICEECGCSLPEEFEDEEGYIIAIWQYSHILGKGAWNEYRHHKLNINRLCLKHHQMWDFGDKESMKIYSLNQKIIQEIKDDPLFLI